MFAMVPFAMRAKLVVGREKRREEEARKVLVLRGRAKLCRQSGWKNRRRNMEEEQK